MRTLDNSKPEGAQNDKNEPTKLSPFRTDAQPYPSTHPNKNQASDPGSIWVRMQS